jgi:DNA-binding response OmpR family regulator
VPQSSFAPYVLVVEDDHALRDLYRSGLRAAGYAVVGVEDGLDALRVIEGATPSAVVLDLALPRLNGREVLGELKANSSTRRIPVIVVTGTDTSDIESKLFSCILKKPIDEDALTAAVEKCVKGWRR